MNSFAQTGAIKGNVYLKYNDYVGDRADAGTTVVLISKDDTTFRQETTADLHGDYSFSGLGTGKYLVILSSKNTVQGRIWTFDRLNNYPNLDLSAWSGGFKQMLSGPLYDSIVNESKEYFKYRFGKKSNARKLGQIDKELSPMINRFYYQMPKSVAERLAIVSPVFNMRYEEVTVKNNTEKVVTDFGTSIVN